MADAIPLWINSGTITRVDNSADTLRVNAIDVGIEGGDPTTLSIGASNTVTAMTIGGGTGLASGIDIDGVNITDAAIDAAAAGTLSVGTATATQVDVGDYTLDLSGGLDLSSAGTMSIGTGTATQLDIGDYSLDLAGNLDLASTGAMTVGGTNATTISIDSSGANLISIGTANASAVQIDDVTVTGLAIDGTGALTLGAANASSVRVDDLTITGAGIDYAGVITIGSTSATDIDIGRVGQTVTMKGDLQVDGAETVTGSATFNGNTDIGDDVSDTLTITASVDAAINFAAAVGSHLTTTSGDLKIVPEGTTIAQGGLGSGLTYTNYTTSSTTLTGTGTSFQSELNVGDAIEVDLDGGTTVDVRTVTAIASDTSLTVGVAFSSDVGPVTHALNTDDNLFEVYNGNADARVTVGKTGGTTFTYGEADGAVLTLANDEDSINAQVFITPDEPPTMSAANGDVAMTTTTGKFYFYGGASWNEAGTSTPTALQGAYDQQGATPVQLLTNDWEVQIDDDAANWVISDEAGTSDYVATNYTNNSLDLGSAAGKEVHFLGNVGTNISFDGTAGRTLTNAEDMTVSATGANSVLTLKADDGAVEINGGTGTTSEYVHITTGDAAHITGGPYAGSITAVTNAGNIEFDASNGTEAKAMWVTNNSITLTHSTGPVSLLTTGGGADIILDATDSANTGDVDIDGVDILLDATDQISLDAAGASNFTVDSDNLTLATTTSGILAVSAVAALDMDGTTVTLDGTNGVSIGGSGAASDFTSTGQNLTIATGTSGDVIVSAAGDFYVNTSDLFVDTSQGNVGINMNTGLDANSALHVTGLDATYSRQIASLTNNEGSAQTCELFVSSNDPDTGSGAGTVAPAGSLCMATTGTAYINTDGTATGWEAVATGDVASTLQEAYDETSGNTIYMTTSKSLEFRTNETGSSESLFLVADSTGANYYFVANSVSDVASIGSGNIDINFGGEAASDLVFEATSAREIRITDQDLTVSCNNSGTLNLYSAGATEVDGNTVAINGVNGIDIGTDADASIDMDASDFALDASGGFSIDGSGAASNVSTTSQNLTLSTITSGTLAVTSVAALDLDGTVTTVDGSTSIGIGTAAAVPVTVGATTLDVNASGDTTIDSSSGVVSINASTGVSDFTSAGSLTLYSQGTSSQMLIRSDATSGNGVEINQAGAGGDIYIHCADNAGSDIEFAAHGSSLYTFNDTADTDLSGFTSSSIIGALNELKAASSDTTTTVTAGEALTKGDLVYLDKTDSSEAKKADSDAAASAVVIGICAADIADAATGEVYLVGDVIVNTNLVAATEGDVVYLHSTAGQVTTTAPASGTVLRMGIVTNAAVSGTATIAIQIGTPVSL